MAHEKASMGANKDGSHPHAPQSVNSWQPDYIEGLFQQFKANPDSVGSEWKNFFLGFELGLKLEGAEGGEAAATPSHAPQAAPSRAPHASAAAAAAPTTGAAAAAAPTTGAAAAATAQRRVDDLIHRYRAYGHLASQLDPLGTTRPFPEDLTLEAVGLDDEALGQSFDPGTLPLDNPSPLSDIIACLEETYCGTMGVEYMHIQSAERRAWLAKRIEGTRNRPQFGADTKKRILSKLLGADSFENFLANRYVGKKRFGLEGGESLIPLLDSVLESGPALGVREFTLGMAHRGRLNVLANIVGKNLQQIFTEFDEAWTAAFASGGGDVKYHMGY